jgi:hypothetical protein
MKEDEGTPWHLLKDVKDELEELRRGITGPPPEGSGKVFLMLSVMTGMARQLTDRSQHRRTEPWWINLTAVSN